MGSRRVVEICIDLRVDTAVAGRGLDDAHGVRFFGGGYISVGVLLHGIVLSNVVRNEVRILNGLVA